MAIKRRAEYCSAESRCYATTARLKNIPGPFLGNGSIKYVPAKQKTEQRPLLNSRFLIMKQLDYGNVRVVIYAVRAERL
jgi:hypothetical protein